MRTLDELVDAARSEGPATIAVTAADAPLPCGLATIRCADTPDLLACVDELYARDGTCETGDDHIDPPRAPEACVRAAAFRTDTLAKSAQWIAAVRALVLA